MSLQTHYVLLDLVKAKQRHKTSLCDFFFRLRSIVLCIVVVKESIA